MMRYFRADSPPEIPIELFSCPICGAQVEFVEINEYETETGKITDTGFHIDCVNVPDVDDPDWEENFNHHWRTPYIDWLPLETRIYKWLSNNYRLIVE